MQWGSILAEKIFFDFLKIGQLANWPINRLSDKKVVGGKVVPYTSMNILVQSGTFYDLQKPRYKIMLSRLRAKKGAAQKSWFACSESVTEIFGVYWDQYQPLPPKIGLFQSISRQKLKMTGLTKF